MGEAVKDLPPEVFNQIDLRVWNICTAEGFQRKKALAVKRCPTLVINGQIIFESIIPPEDEMLAAMGRFLGRPA